MVRRYHGRCAREHGPARRERPPSLDFPLQVQQQRLIEVQRERDELFDAFERSVYEVQQKAGMRSVLLERKLETLSEVLEKKEAKLAEVLAASNLDPQTLQRVNQKLEEVLSNKNDIIKVRGPSFVYAAERRTPRRTDVTPLSSCTYARRPSSSTLPRSAKRTTI